MKIITIGKIRNKNLFSEINGLKKRISRLEIVELKEIHDKNCEIIKKKEFNLIKPLINSSNYNVLLIEDGKEFSTSDFYDKLKNKNSNLVFFITGPFGPCDELRNLCDLNLSLSKMTFTHEQALYLLIEQIYRMHCFSRNIPYTK